MPLNEPAVTRIIGVYNAHGTLRGELSYLLRRTFAGEHCALCDITHSSVRRRPDWDRYVQNFSLEHGVTVNLLHLDEVPVELTQQPHFEAPAVYFQRSDQTFVIAMNSDELDSCEHSPGRLFEILTSKLSVGS